MRLDSLKPVWFLLVLTLAATDTLTAELPGPSPTPAPSEAPAVTPRQSLQRVEALFAQGHVFDEKEMAGLSDLRTQLADAGDKGLAADLDLLILGTKAKEKAIAAEAMEITKLDEDTNHWNDRVNFDHNKEFWKTVRDVGLATFTVSAMATLLLAVVNDRDQALMTNNYNNYNNNYNGNDRQTFSDRMNWAMAGSTSAMLLSLFPLLWGEARQ